MLAVCGCAAGEWAEPRGSVGHRLKPDGCGACALAWDSPCPAPPGSPGAGPRRVLCLGQPQPRPAPPPADWELLVSCPCLGTSRGTGQDAPSAHFRASPGHAPRAGESKHAPCLGTSTGPRLCSYQTRATPLQGGPFNPTNIKSKDILPTSKQMCNFFFYD